MSVKSQLTMKEHDDFFNRGYFIRPGLFSASEVGEMIECFDELQLEAQKYSSTVIKNNSQFVVEQDRIDRIVWACGSAPNLKNFARDPRLVLPSALLLQSVQLTQLICQAHFKLPGDEVMFDWHQDSQHRGHGTEDWVDINQKGSFVQSLVALDGTPLESGPLYFIENTVGKGHLALNKPENLNRFVDKDQAVPVLLQPGDTIFFHPFAVHGSYPNVSDHPRRVFINGFCHPQANKKVYPGCGLGETFLAPIAPTPAA